jgi:U3 small nucleolar RNA-associated protein 5
VIRNTIARLAPTDAALFLKAAVERLQTRPARAGALLPWLRATLLSHTAYLSTAPGVQAHLTAVYQLIEARLAVFQPMLALRGRLDLVLSQRSSEIVSVDQQQQGPLVRYSTL